jgi:PhnB protein
MPTISEENRSLKVKISQMEQALGRLAFELHQRLQLQAAACSDVVAALTVSNPADAISFYSEILGAREGFRIHDKEGEIAHAALQIGGTQLFINAEYPEQGFVSPSKLGGAGVTLHVFVDDVKSSFNQAIKAGCKEVSAPKEEFWGDERAIVADPFGHRLILARNRDRLSVGEIVSRAEREFGRPQG